MLASLQLRVEQFDFGGVKKSTEQKGEIVRSVACLPTKIIAAKARAVTDLLKSSTL